MSPHDSDPVRPGSLPVLCRDGVGGRLEPGRLGQHVAAGREPVAGEGTVSPVERRLRPVVVEPLEDVERHVHAGGVGAFERDEPMKCGA